MRRRKAKSPKAATKALLGRIFDEQEALLASPQRRELLRAHKHIAMLMAEALHEYPEVRVTPKKLAWGIYKASA